MFLIISLGRWLAHGCVSERLKLRADTEMSLCGAAFTANRATHWKNWIMNLCVKMHSATLHSDTCSAYIYSIKSQSLSHIAIFVLFQVIVQHLLQTNNGSWSSGLCIKITILTISVHQPGETWLLSDGCHSVLCNPSGTVTVQSHRINCEKMEPPVCKNSLPALRYNHTCGCTWTCPCMNTHP